MRVRGRNDGAVVTGKAAITRLATLTPCPSPQGRGEIALIEMWRYVLRITGGRGEGKAQRRIMSDHPQRIPAGLAWQKCAVLALSLLLFLSLFVPAQAKSLTIVAFGDSLTAGYMLGADQAFPAVLEKALRNNGFDISVVNAGVSGDTTSGGLERLEWSIPDGTDGVILELGANDMLRGTDPALARKNLEAMITALNKRHIPVFLAGMYAVPTLGTDYIKAFNAIFPDLAKEHGLPFYPFFLDGIVGQRDLHLSDGMHPNAAGVEIVVHSIQPAIEAWLKSLG